MEDESRGADILADFQMLEEMLYQEGVGIQNFLSISLKREIREHLETLQNSIKSYFYLDGIKVEPWICNSFLTVSKMLTSQDELTDLRTKGSLQLEFNLKRLGEFWCSLRETYPRLVNRAMEDLIAFAKICLYESGFSTLVTIKTKYLNRLDVQHDVRVALSNTSPQFNVLIQAKQ
jgi:hypothetical protein